MRSAAAGADADAGAAAGDGRVDVESILNIAMYTNKLLLHPSDQLSRGFVVNYYAVVGEYSR